MKENSDSTSHEKFYGVTPSLINHLRTFGEMAIVHDGKKIRSKLTNHGIPCMFIGYPDDHSPDVYQFLNLETEKVIMSRNYIWLNKSYGEFKNLKIIHIPEPKEIKKKEAEEFEFMEIEDLDEYEDFIIVQDKNEIEEYEIIDEPNYEMPDEEGHNTEETIETDSINEIDSDEESEDEHSVSKSRLKGVNRVLKSLESWFNPNPWEFLEDSASLNLIDTGERLMVTNIHDGSPEPKTIYEARKTKDWNNWWKAISTEFQNMEEKGVWEVVKRSDIPTGRKIIGNRPSAGNGHSQYYT